MQDKLHCVSDYSLPSLIIHVNRQSNTVQLYIQGCSNSDLTYKRCANKIQHYWLSLEPSLLDTAFKQRQFLYAKNGYPIFSVAGLFGTRCSFSSVGSHRILLRFHRRSTENYEGVFVCRQEYALATCIMQSAGQVSS